MSLQDLIILNNKCEELERKLVSSESQVLRYKGLLYSQTEQGREIERLKEELDRVSDAYEKWKSHDLVTQSERDMLKKKLAEYEECNISPVQIKACPSCGKHKNVAGMIQEEPHGRYRYWRCGDCQDTWMEPNQVLRLENGRLKHENALLKEKLAEYENIISLADKVADMDYLAMWIDHAREVLSKWKREEGE